MFLANSQIMNQFNIYKFIELNQKLEIIPRDWGDNTRKLALEIIEE